MAPRSEQARIADQLDALVSRIQACNDQLGVVPVLLKRFRRAVFAAATSGDLTGDWRNGKALPDWSHERAADVCAKVQSGGTPKEGFQPSGIPFLKVYNIVDQKVAFDAKPQFIAPGIHAGSMAKSQTLPGDVLMNIVGPPLGKVAIVPADRPAWNINQAITLFRPSDRVTSVWLYIVLCDGKNIEAITHETKGSAGQVNISLSQCRDFVLPTPCLEEQAEIARRVEALFKIADRIEARLTGARTLAQRLTPLVLAKAFRGELVPQDPSDEPANALLALIAADRANPATAPKTRQFRQPRAASTPQENAAMTKSRQDKDVLHQPYLAKHLRRLGVPASAEALFKVAELPVGDFYKQLAWEVAQGHVRDGTVLLEPRDAA